MAFSLQSLQPQTDAEIGKKSDSLEAKSRLEKLWDDLANTNAIPEAELRPPILESWQRCLHMKVDPLDHKPEQISPKEIEHRLKKNNEWLKALEPVIECVDDLVTASNYAISFVDSEGYVLTIHGNLETKRNLQNVSFLEGTRWTEKHAGTTAVGITLATKQPSHVFHAEHFCEGLHNFTCMAVPLRDPSSNEVTGVLDFVGCFEDHQDHAMAMALQMGRCVELEIYKSRKEKDEFFRECSTQLSLDQLDRGILVLDENDRIRRANLKAIEHLNLNSSKLLGLKFNDVSVFSEWKNLEKTFVKSVSGDKIIRMERKPLQHQKQHIGFIIFLEPAEEKSILKARQVSSEGWRPIGNSPAFQTALQTAENAAHFDSNVLITGQTGTGKEVIARYIHQTSPRKNKPFIAINCGSIPKDLLGSELFGYEAGAFTGAHQKGHPSKFELANGGTLLLDEISEMPIESQVYLLRVIEEKTVTHLGGNKAISVETRVIASANRNLEKEVEAGRFRADLLFRLNVLRIDLPRLLDRKEDIPLLADYFLQDLSQKMGQNIPVLEKEVIPILQCYHWPGNVRELRNTMEQAIVVCRGDAINWKCIPDHIRNDSHNPGGIPEKERARYHAFIKAFNDANGNISKVAKLLNVSRPTVYAWKKKFAVS